MAEFLFSAAGNGRWRFEGVLGFATAPAVLEASAECFTHGREVEIDLGGVTRADSAGLALLLEWLREAQRSGKVLEFTHVPGQLLAIAGLCGLGDILSLNGKQ